MIRSIVLVFLILISVCFKVNAQEASLKSPSAFLSYKHSTRFTPHHLLVDYFRHVADVSDKVQLVEYGKTYELRPLIAAFISSPQNLARLEEIRQNNLKRAGVIKGEAKAEDISIVQLSYSVHGNEAAGSESAMTVLHALAQGNAETNQWLANTIVILDPCLNPDGYSRYVEWNNSVSHEPYNANPESREHKEP